jgi:hypothetical protein
MRSLKAPKTSQHVSAAGQCLAEISFLSCCSWWGLLLIKGGPEVDVSGGPHVQLCQDVVLPGQEMISKLKFRF